MRPTRVLAAAVAVVALASTVLSVDVVPFVSSAPVGAAPVLEPSIDPTNRASVLTAYRTTLLEAQAVPVGWTGNTGTCTKGTESQASIDATRAAMNFYRRMNRLPVVSLDPALNSQALAAALIMQANNRIDHFPAANWPCYTDEGAVAARSSNLASTGGARSVGDYVTDRGTGNYFAGHRRYVLDPRRTTFGTGSTTSFNALWVFAPRAARPTGADWVAWPSEGFVPKPLVPSRFSLSSNVYPDADYSAASVTVRVGATSLPVTINKLETGYGDNTLVWDVTLPADFTRTDEDVRFDISVAGIRTAAGAALPTRSYSSTAVVGGVPSAPTALSAAPGDARATLSWNPPATTNGGPVVTGYRVFTAVDGVEQNTMRSFDASTTTRALVGLVNGTTYTFRVQALNADGTGSFSAWSNPVTAGAVATVPGAPTGPTATAGDGRATVSWTAPASNGGSAVTGYVVTPYVGAVAQAARSFTSTATSQVVTGLTNGTQYTFRVQAVNAVGTGAMSGYTSAVTPTAAPTAPGAPTGVGAVAGDGRATVSWSAPASNGGSAVTGYVVTPYVGAVAQAARPFTSTATSQVVAGLTNGTQYTFRVQAVNAVGTGAMSASSNAVTPVAPGPDAWAPFGSWTHLVDQLHLRMLGRAPTTNERTLWVGGLTADSVAPGDLVEALRGSTRHTTVIDPVARLYRAFFLRIPDRGGLEFWIAQREGGRSLPSIAEAMAQSSEFRNRYGSLTNRQFVDLVYQNVLGRPGEIAGVDYWTTELDARRRTRGAVMVGFSESGEYRRAQEAEVTVAVLHILLLHRAPTPAEFDAAVADLDDGRSVADHAESVIAAITP